MLWANETSFSPPLLVLAISCVKDIVNHNKLYAPISILLSQEDGSWVKPDFTCITASNCLELHHILVEMKVALALNNNIIQSILKQAKTDGEWSAGNFPDLKTKQYTSDIQKAASMM